MDFKNELVSAFNTKVDCDAKSSPFFDYIISKVLRAFFEIAY